MIRKGDKVRVAGYTHIGKVKKITYYNSVRHCIVELFGNREAIFTEKELELLPSCSKRDSITTVKVRGRTVKIVEQ